MGKAAENERRKLRATFYNNCGVGLLVAGLLVPYIAFLRDAGDFLPFLTGDAEITAAGARRFIAGVAAFWAAMYGAYKFRRRADEVIQYVED
jgi:hypothetical protein